jgi:hypothetical protein
MDKYTHFDIVNRILKKSGIIQNERFKNSKSTESVFGYGSISHVDQCQCDYVDEFVLRLK